MLKKVMFALTLMVGFTGLSFAEEAVNTEEAPAVQTEVQVEEAVSAEAVEAAKTVEAKN